MVVSSAFSRVTRRYQATKSGLQSRVSQRGRPPLCLSRRIVQSRRTSTFLQRFFATCCASRRHRLYRGCASHRHRLAWQLMGTSLGELDWCQDHCMKMFLLHGVFEDNGGDRRGSHCQLGIHSEGGLGFHSNGDGEGVGELTMVLASAWNLRSVTRSIFHRHDVLQMRMRDVKCCKRIFRHDWSRPGQLKYRP